MRLSLQFLFILIGCCLLPYAFGFWPAAALGGTVAWDYPAKYEALLDLHAGTRRAVAAVGNRAVLLDWDRQLPTFWLSDNERVADAVFSPDGSQLAVFSHERIETTHRESLGWVSWWDLHSRRLLGRWSWADSDCADPPDSMPCYRWGGELRFAPDSASLTAASKRQVCRFRPGAQETCVAIPANPERFGGLTVTGEAAWILLKGICCSSEEHQLWRWDGRHEPGLILQNPPGVRSETWWQLSGETLLEYSDTRLRELELPALRPGPWRPLKLDAQGVQALHLVPGVPEALLVVSSNSTELWRLEPLQRLHSFKAPYFSKLDALGRFALLRDRQSQQVWALGPRPAPVSVRWKLADYGARSYQSYWLFAGPDRILAYHDGGLLSWNDPRNPWPETIYAPEGSLGQACFLPDGRRLLAFSYQEIDDIQNPDAPSYDQKDTVRWLFVYDLLTRRSLPFASGKYDDRIDGNEVYSHEVFSPGCRTLAVRDGETLDVWDLERMRVRSLAADVEDLVALSPDGRWLLASERLGLSERKYSLIELASGRHRQVLPQQLSFGQSQMIGIDWDASGQASLYRAPLALDAAFEAWPLPGLRIEKMLALSPDARWVLLLAFEDRGPSRSSRRMLYLADLQTRRLLTLSGPPGQDMDRLLKQDERRLGIVSDRGRAWVWKADGSRLLLWDLASGSLLTPLESGSAFTLADVLPVNGIWWAVDLTGRLLRLPSPP
ncbi:MAG: hypothetical protein ACAI44_04230 [Candidatus Sericytochromatia bacterium]